MATYHVEDSEFATLKGKTVLITGGVTGIGRATVELAHQYGANLIIGDVLDQQGQYFATDLGERVLFRKCDVSKWDDVLGLFKAGYQRFGAIDIVLANAGVNEIGSLLGDTTDSATGDLMAPNLATLNINLIGVIYTTKCATHYFKKNGGRPCQLVLTGSAACFLDTPPLYTYSASKAGVMGLMRALRTQLPKNSNVTVNMVAPWMTSENTNAAAGIFQRMGRLPANESIGVAKALLLPAVNAKLNGKSFFIAGHEIVDLEEGLIRTQPEWMGKELSDNVNEGQRRIVQ